MYATSEAWPRKFKPETTKREEVVSPYPPGRPRMKKDQKRRNTISIAMSEEEELIVRQAAAARGISISEMVRIAIFKYIRLPIPERDLSRRDWSQEAATGEKHQTGEKYKTGEKENTYRKK